MKRIAVLLCGMMAACNYDTGECFLRDEGGQGVGGGVVTLPGVGGFGDVPPEPQDASDPPPPECALAEETRCVTPGSDACVKQCEAIGAFCVHRAAHPYSPSTGIGDLYWCKGGSPTWTCSYQYSNGDNCTAIYPLATWLCRYAGGK